MESFDSIVTSPAAFLGCYPVPQRENPRGISHIHQKYYHPDFFLSAYRKNQHVPVFIDRFNDSGRMPKEPRHKSNHITIMERKSSHKHSYAFDASNPKILPEVLIEDFLVFIEECVKEKNLAHAISVHLYICINGLENHAYLGNSLLSMWVELESIFDAKKGFYKLDYVTECSFLSLMRAYIKCGDLQNAVSVYHSMQENFMCVHSILLLLKACHKCYNIVIGYEIHIEIIKKGFLESNHYLSGSLVDMYIKFGLLLEAQQVLDFFPAQDVLVWTALLAGYVEHNQGTKALVLFEKMRSKGISPNSITFACVLKACGSIGDMNKGIEIHNLIDKMGLFGTNRILGNALTDMYVKCGNLDKAQEVFDNLSIHDVVSWTTLIAGYIKYEYNEKAINCYKHMQLEGVQPDAAVFTCILKVCSSLENYEEGQFLHVEIAERGLLQGNHVLGNALVAMYAKCGSLTNAVKVFNELPVHDTVSWNTLIAGYAQHECVKEVLSCLERMYDEGILPDVMTYACVLKACGNIDAIDRGDEIHCEIYKRGLNKDIFIGNALIDMYAKSGMVQKAQEVFDKMPVHDIVSWNTLISGYVHHEHDEKALDFFQKIQINGFCPDSFSLTCSLKACGNIGATDIGRTIHAEIAKKGLLEGNLVVGNALLDMYAKCGMLVDAQKVFQKLHVRDVVSWTALIAGYVSKKFYCEALDCFAQMKLEGISPNAVTFACVLRACSGIDALDECREIHAELICKGLVENDLSLGTSLVDMYSKIGLLSEAKNVFDTVRFHDVVTYTALITGYVMHRHEEEALSHFNQMQLTGLCPSEFTYACILKAFGGIGAMDMGRTIHSDLEKRGLLEKNLVLGTALIDMYAKSSLLVEAQTVFDGLPVRDMFTWNSLMTGYAQLGDAKTLLCILERMRGKGNEPDAVTFLSILNSCCHAGLIDEGDMYFEVMRKQYGITPALEHCTCMIDLLGRAGQLDTFTVAMIMETSFSMNVEMWLAVLAACWRCANVEIGGQAFEQLTRLDANSASPYICMYNIYSDANMQEDNFAEMRKAKSPGLIHVSSV